jgi:outer membrane lipoprotein-sorting protein
MRPIKINNPNAWLIIVTSLLFSAVTHAETPQERGLYLAKERKARNLGWGDSQSSMKMILRNASGQESIREVRSKNLEINGDGDKGLTIFDKPADVKGTAFLNFSHVNKPDDQWLFLPALKRVKRINSRNKSGPFMGSEFSYEDLSSFEVEKYDYEYLGETTLNGEDCYIVQGVPKDKNSGYKRLVTYMDKAHFRVHKIEYYDRKNSPLKTMQASRFKLYQEKYWRPHLMEVVNHQTNKSTRLEIDEIRFGTGLSNKDFNKNSLKRAR